MIRRRPGRAVLGLMLAASVAAAEPAPEVEAGCRALAGVLGSVSMNDCLEAGLEPAGGRTVQGRPILMREYPPLAPREPQGRVLLLGGIHGDEYSSFSVIFRWMRTLDVHHSGLFHWRVVPGLNLDGLNAGPAVRTNANGIDLNRNFPTPNWHENQQEYWVERTGRDPRRYPGEAPLSEPESRWLFAQIEAFRPDAIVTVHAPLGVVDFDGPKTPPRRLGYLDLHRLGAYPGSLGNFAGLNRGIPVLTLELPHAGIMPSHAESAAVWRDLVAWLTRHVHSLPGEPSPRGEPPQRIAAGEGYSTRDSCTICQPDDGSLRQNCCLRDTAWKLLLE